MGTKTIRVREDVYDRLKARKLEGESFSDLLERLTDRTAAFERGFGALRDIDFEAALDELDRRFEDDFQSRQ